MQEKPMGDFKAAKWTLQHVKHDLRLRGVFKNSWSNLWYAAGGAILTAWAIHCEFLPRTWSVGAQTAIYAVLFTLITLLLWYLRCLHVIPARNHAELSKSINALRSELEHVREQLVDAQGLDDILVPDMGLWEAILYILNETSEGYGRSELKIVEFLRWGANQGKFRVYATPKDGFGIAKVDSNVFDTHSFRASPTESECTISQITDVAVLFLGIPDQFSFKEPMFSRKQIEAICPRSQGEEFSQGFRSALLARWKEMLSEADTWVSLNKNREIEIADVYLDCHPPARLYFDKYHKTRNISLPWWDHKAISDPKDWIDKFGREIEIIAHQWGVVMPPTSQTSDSSTGSAR